MTIWDSEQYLKYDAERLRPALDLMAQITLEQPKTIVDLGCGPGNVTAVLGEKYPQSQITGVDSSKEMLMKAAEIEGVDWQEADISSWKPAAPLSLIFSNAALHWVRDHADLLPQLMSFLEPGGQLAIQVPYNQSSPSHSSIVDTVTSGPWETKLTPLLDDNQVEKPSFYYDLLTPLSTSLSIWQSEYLHVLEGENPVVEWTRGTALKGFLDALEDERERAAFLAQYSRRTAQAYPKQSNGKTLLPFRRLFMVAKR